MADMIMSASTVTQRFILATMSISRAPEEMMSGRGKANSHCSGGLECHSHGRGGQYCRCLGELMVGGKRKISLDNYSALYIRKA
jgi:hypothetical protein